MIKARLILLLVIALPLALFLAKVALTTSTGGMNDGGQWA